MASMFGQMPELETIRIHTPEQRSLLGVSSTLTLCAGLTTVLRVYSRKLRKKKLRADDWFCFVAMILAVATLVIQWIMVFNGAAGLDLHTAGRKRFILWTRLQVITTFLWIMSVSALQISILMFYVSTFGIYNTLRRIFYGMVAVVVAWLIATSGTYLFRCDPLRKVWNPFIPGNCDLCAPICTSILAVHIALDIFILVIPVHRTWKLQMSRSSKAVLTFLLLLGLFATMCALMRLQCIVKFFPHSSANLFNADYWRAILLQLSEVPVGIICACVPTLRPVAQKIARSKLATTCSSLIPASWSSHTQPPVPGKPESDFGYKSSPRIEAQDCSKSISSEVTSANSPSSEARF